MKKIRVTRGGCGIAYTDEHGAARHTLKTAESGPFMCDDAQADRLVRLGVAAYVNTTTGEKAPTPSVTDPEQVQQGGSAEPEPETVTGHLDPDDLAGWEYNDLKKLAADLGVKPASKRKEDLIAAIVAVEVEAPVEDDDLPDLGVADPE